MGSGTSSTSGTFGTNRRRRRPFPDTSYNVGRHAGSQHQAGMMTSSAYGQLLAEGRLPLLIPNYPAAPFRDKAKDTLVPGSHVTREPPLELGIGKSRRKAGRYGSHHDTKNDSSAAAGRTHVHNSSGGASRSKRSLPESNGGLFPGGVAGGGGDVIPNADGALLDHHGRSGLKDEQSQPGLIASHTGERGGQVVSSGPSAIDLFDQCGFVVPDAVVKVEGLVGTSRPRQSWKSPSDDHNMVDIMVTTPPAAGQGVARVSPVDMLPVVPGREWVDSVSSRVRQRNPVQQEKRVSKATRRSHVAPGQPRPPVSGGSPPSPPRGFRSKAAPGMGTGPTKNNRRIRRGVGDTAEKRTSRLGHSNGPSPTETKAPAKADRVRRRWNFNEPSATIPVPSPPNAGQQETVTSSEQRLVSAQARLHKSKNLDALKSEHVEALSILQDISCPSAAETRGAASDGDEDRKCGDIQAARSDPRERDTSKTARSPKSLALDAVGTTGARIRGVLGPGDADYEALSAYLPRTDSREHAALRLLYREWWTEVTNDSSASNVPDPLEVPEPPGDAAFEEWRRNFVGGGGGGGSGGATPVVQGGSVYESTARRYIEALVEVAVGKAARVSKRQASGTAGTDKTADISTLARLQGAQEAAAAVDGCNRRCMAEAESGRDAVTTNESPQPAGSGSEVAPHPPETSPPTPPPVPINKANHPRVAARVMPSPARRAGNGKPLQGKRHHAGSKRDGTVKESTPGVTTNSTKQYRASRAVARATPSPARQARKDRPLQERRPRVRPKRDGARGLVSVEEPTPRVAAKNINYSRATASATPAPVGPKGNGKSQPDGRRDVHPKHDEAPGVVAVEEPISTVTANNTTLSGAAAITTAPASAGRAGNGNLRQVTRGLARLEADAREDEERGVVAIEDEGVDSVLDEDGLEAEEEQGHDGRIYLPDGRFVSTLRKSLDDKGDAAEAIHGDENIDGDDGGVSVFGAMRDERVARASESNDDGEYGDDDFEH